MRRLVSSLPEPAAVGVDVESDDAWSDAARQALIEDFLDTPHGRDVDDPDHRGLLESLWWFGIDYSGGDPLRWSPMNGEILLTDWFPRKVIAGSAYLGKLPGAAGLDRLQPRGEAHPAGTHRGGARRGRPLGARPPSAVESGPQGTAALFWTLLEGEGLDDHVGGWRSAPDPADLVGGVDALARLDLAPLPDEPFDWDGVPDDLAD